MCLVAHPRQHGGNASPEKQLTDVCTRIKIHPLGLVDYFVVVGVSRQVNKSICGKDGYLHAS